MTFIFYIIIVSSDSRLQCPLRIIGYSIPEGIVTAMKLCKSISMICIRLWLVSICMTRTIASNEYWVPTLCLKKKVSTTYHLISQPWNHVNKIRRDQFAWILPFMVHNYHSFQFSSVPLGDYVTITNAHCENWVPSSWRKPISWSQPWNRVN